MKRRGFIGAAVAGVSGLFFSQKVNAHALSASLKFGDAVKVKKTGSWFMHKDRGVHTISGYIVYVDKNVMVVRDGMVRVECNWNESEKAWCHFEKMLQIEVINPEEV